MKLRMLVWKKYKMRNFGKIENAELWKNRNRAPDSKNWKPWFDRRRDGRTVTGSKGSTGLRWARDLEKMENAELSKNGKCGTVKMIRYAKLGMGWAWA